MSGFPTSPACASTDWPRAMTRVSPTCIKVSRQRDRLLARPPMPYTKAPPGSMTLPISSHPLPRTRAMLQRSRGHAVVLSTRCRGSLRSHPPWRRLVCTSTRSVGAIGPVCSLAMRSQACRGPTTSWQATFARRVAACCGPRAHRGKRSGRCNARAPGNSCPTPRQKPRDRRAYVLSPPRTWRRSGSVWRRIARVSACRGVP